MAENYAKGALGEALTGEVLDRLPADSWRVLHDRRDPAGGNIDHLAIGPPGVAVIDAKHWTESVTITPDRRLVASKHDRTKALDHLNDMVERVRALTSADGVKVAVRGYLVLTGDADREREAKDIGDLRVMGVENLNDRLLRARGDLAPDMVEALARSLDLALPPAAARAPEPGSAGSTSCAIEPSPLFDKANRFYYLRSWKRGGHHRLYLRSSDGTNLGWTDVNTGAMNLECGPAEAKFAEALLAAADPTGMKLAPGDLPKVATRLWGGRLLSRIARFHVSVLVGQEWRAFGKHRLYGTLIDPAVSTFNLGYVDLKTGQAHPSVHGPLAKDRSPAERYLGYLLHRMPDAKKA